MSTNIRNTGTAIGRLTRDPAVFANKDGSHKVMLTLACQDNFKSGADKKRGTNFVSVEAFVPAGKGTGVYAYMHQGDLVGVEYSVRSSSYTKDGETQYVQSLLVQSVDLMESKKTTEARQAKNAAQVQAAALAQAAAILQNGGIVPDAEPELPEDDDAPFEG